MENEMGEFVTPASSRPNEVFSQTLPARCRRYKLLSKFRSQIKTHASSAAGEVCGFLYEHDYFPLPNVANDTHRFYADPASLASVLARFGEPLAIFHTHPEGCLDLSLEDKRMWYYFNSTMIVGCMMNGRFRWKMYGKPGH